MNIKTNRQAMGRSLFPLECQLFVEKSVTKYNKYVVYQKFQHIDVILSIFLFEISMLYDKETRLSIKNKISIFISTVSNFVKENLIY